MSVIPTKVVKPEKGEDLLPVAIMHFPSFRELLGAPKRKGHPKHLHELRDRHIAYERVRLEKWVAPKDANAVLSVAYAVDARTVERAVRAHRKEAELNQDAYVLKLVRLGRLAPTKNMA
jgi:hypothetical protein